MPVRHHGLPDDGRLAGPVARGARGAVHLHTARRSPALFASSPGVTGQAPASWARVPEKSTRFRPTSRNSRRLVGSFSSPCAWMPVTAFAVVHSAAHADLEHLVEVDLILLTVDLQLQRLLALGVGGRSKGPRSGAPCSRRLAGPRTTWPCPPRPPGNASRPAWRGSRNPSPC